jgi:hypothetical protein
MEAVNKREKGIAFLKFASLFLVVIILVTLAIYFDFQIPKQEIKVLRAMNEKLSQQVEVQEEILSIADSLHINFNRIDDPNQLFRVLEGKISKDINSLQDFANDSSFQGKIVKNIHASYFNWLRDKTVLQKNMDVPKELQKLKEELKEVQNDLRDCRLDTRKPV